MTWKPVGRALIRASDLEVRVGSVDVGLSDRTLFLRCRSNAGRTMIPLAFGIVVPRSTVEGSAAPTGRYYPQESEGLVALGPCLGSRFTGEILFRPRSYNLRWLEVGLPGKVWDLNVDVWGADGSTSPTFRVSGWTDGTYTFSISGDRVGPAGAAPLTRD